MRLLRQRKFRADPCRARRRGLRRAGRTSMLPLRAAAPASITAAREPLSFPDVVNQALSKRPTGPLRGRVGTPRFSSTIEPGVRPVS